MKNDKLTRLAVIAEYIPKEMFWAYESVRQSGIWNMLCVNPRLGRYQSGSDPKEMIQVMDDIYIRYVAQNNVDVDDPKNKMYTHMQKEHVLFIQEAYGELYEFYGLPDKIIEIKKEIKIETKINII